MTHHTCVAAQSEVREQIQRMNAAILAKDIGRIMGFYSAEITAFDAVAQLQFKGVEAYRQHWASCMASCPEAGIFEIHELQVHASEDLAVAHWLTRCGPDANQTGWMRATQAWRQERGEWLIVHDHWSAPFDMETGKALFDLLPQGHAAFYAT